MNAETILKLRRRYLHECRKLKEASQLIDEGNDKSPNGAFNKITDTDYEAVINDNAPNGAPDEFSPEAIF